MSVGVGSVAPWPVSNSVATASCASSSGSFANTAIAVSIATSRPTLTSENRTTCRPGKFGLRRGSTNAESSAKAMKTSATVRIPAF